MTRRRLEELRRRIGGRFLGDPKVFLALAPLWFIFSLLVVPGVFVPRVLFAAGLANLVSITASLGLLFLVRQTLFRNRLHTPVPLTVVLLTGAVLGATKGALTVFLIDALAPELNYLEALPDRTLGGTTVGVFLLAGSALVLATRQRLRDEREALQHEQSARFEQTSRPGRPVPREEEPAIQQARTLLQQARDLLRVSMTLEN